MTAIIAMVFRNVNSSGNGGHDVKTMALTLVSCSLPHEEGDEGIQKKRNLVSFPGGNAQASSCSFLFVWRSLGPKLRLGETKLFLIVGTTPLHKFTTATMNGAICYSGSARFVLRASSQEFWSERAEPSQSRRLQS
jgi:hypothetical protein